jgi:hypothetical protein
MLTYVHLCIMYIFRGRCLARSAAMPDLCFAGHDGAAGAELAHILKSTGYHHRYLLLVKKKNVLGR